MSNQEWLELLQLHRAIAVIRTPSVSLGVQLACAVATGGIRLIEVTWNSTFPEKIVRQLRATLPNCAIGAGTLISTEQASEAIDAGAQFLFSPHTDEQLIQQAIAANIPMIPGALTPTEIIAAWQAGASSVKVFPIQGVGGANYLQSLRGPLGHIPLVPTGGVTLDNAADFLQAGAMGVGLSSQLFPQHLVAEQNWTAIANNSRILVQRLQKYCQTIANSNRV